MSQQTDIIEMLEQKLTVPVFSDNIPEKQTATAVSVINLGFTSNRNLISGKKSGRSSTWRATVVSQVRGELESVLDELESLDNKSVSGFQKIMVDHTQLEPSGFSEPFKRAFVTITAYK